MSWSRVVWTSCDGVTALFRLLHSCILGIAYVYGQVNLIHCLDFFSLLNGSVVRETFGTNTRQVLRCTCRTHPDRHSSG